MICQCGQVELVLTGIQYAEFKKNHPGGDHYNLEKWSKKQKAEYTFGTKENDRRMKEIMGEEDSD